MVLPNQSVQQPNRVKNMLGLQDVVQSRGLEDDRQLIEGSPPQGLSATPISQPMGMPQQLPEDPMMQQQPSSLNAIFKKRIRDKDGTETDLLTEITEAFVDRMPVAEKETPLSESPMMQQQPVDLQFLGRSALGFNPETATPQDGGLIGMAAGGMFDGRVPGNGHGMEDNVFMPIRDGREQVGTLAVSPKEYVVDAHTMSALGNGNPDEGANVMDEVVENIREQAYGTDRQPNEISGLAALRPMTERV